MRAPDTKRSATFTSGLAPWALWAAALVAAPAHAVTYTEAGDAGQTVATAQAVNAAAGPLTAISGSLSSVTDADLFLINITSPGSFTASTTSAANGIDTQLFLFTLAGVPVYANDDAPDGSSLGSVLDSGTVFSPTSAGLYILGVAMSGYNPVNTSAQFLFALAASPLATQGPTAGLQPAVLGGWDGAGTDAPGAYRIELTGVAVAAVPEPSTALMFLAAGALGLAARRRPVPAAA